MFNNFFTVLLQTKLQEICFKRNFAAILKKIFYILTLLVTLSYGLHIISNAFNESVVYSVIDEKEDLDKCKTDKKSKTDFEIFYNNRYFFIERKDIKKKYENYFNYHLPNPHLATKQLPPNL